MDIATTMTEIVRRQGLLVITAPISESIAKAWPYFPPDAVGVPEAPCFMNSWSMIDEANNDSSQLIQHYVIHSQLFVKDTDRDRAAAIATAFHVALIAAFAPHPTLAGIVTDQKIRGGTPTLTNLERAGVSYMGLDLFMDVTLKDPMTFDAA